MLGQREGDTARLQEALAAFRNALNEYTRERAPLNWATSTGNQGVALSFLARRTGNAESAKTAVALIESARDTTQAGGSAPDAAYYEAQVAVARNVLLQILRQ